MKKIISNKKREAAAVSPPKKSTLDRLRQVLKTLSPVNSDTLNLSIKLVENTDTPQSPSIIEGIKKINKQFKKYLKKKTEENWQEVKKSKAALINYIHNKEH